MQSPPARRGNALPDRSALVTSPVYERWYAMTRKDAERQEFIEKLREILKPGDIVYTTVKHVSRSGMSRSIDVHVIRDNQPVWLSYWVAKAIDAGFDERHEAVKMGGCDMDMGFALVYDLSRILFPDGFGEKCIWEECTYRPATKYEAEHCNDNLAEGVTPHIFGGRNGDPSGWDNDGGYALIQKWM